MGRYRVPVTRGERRGVLIAFGCICLLMGIIMLVVGRDEEGMGMVGVVMLVFAGIFFLGVLLACIDDGAFPGRSIPKKRVLRIRGQLDLELIPQIFYRDPGSFMSILAVAGGELFAKLYNDIYVQVEQLEKRRMPHYTKDDMPCQTKVVDGCPMIWVDLPPKVDDSDRWATAVVLIGSKRGPKYFTVEHTRNGAQQVCSVDAQGGHRIYGRPAPYREGIMDQICELANATEEPKKSAPPVQQPPARRFGQKCYHCAHRYSYLRPICPNCGIISKSAITWVLLTVLTAALILGLVCGTRAVKAASAYRKAVTCMEKGDYVRAREVFLSLGDYRDAPEQSEEARRAYAYTRGLEAWEREDYAAAAELFREAENYQDARTMAAEADKGHHYQLGCAALEREEGSLAAEELAAAGDWPGAAEKLPEARDLALLQEAVALMEEGAYADALRLLEELGDYRDSLLLLRECCYRLGSRALEAGDRAAACDHLARAIGYSDAGEKVKVLAMELGRELLLEKAYSAAAERFAVAVEADGQDDQAAWYMWLCRAEAALAEGRLREGMDAYDQIPDSFRPAEFNVRSRKTALWRYKSFAALDGHWSADSYTVRIGGTVAGWEYKKGALKDQYADIRCTLNADGTVTVACEIKYYYLDQIPVAGEEFEDKHTTVSFTLEGLSYAPYSYSYDSHTTVFFSASGIRLYYQPGADRDTISDVIYGVRE